MKSHQVKYLAAGIAVMQSMAIAALEEMPLAYQLVGEAYQIPSDILYAVAMTESSKAYRNSQQPWPWTLNIDGVGIYCSSQQEALVILERAIRERRSVDIGLMQINWRWYKRRFSDPAESLIPLQNLKAGAAILREQFDQVQDWWEAVGRYHSPGVDENSLAKAEGYRQRVVAHWEKAFQ